jgi:hypothetical protein
VAGKRTLGLTETYLKYCYEHAKGTTGVVAMVGLSGPLTEQLVEKSLRAMQRRHPLLRAFLAESKEKREYLKIDKRPSMVPLQIVKRKRPDQWRDVYERNLNICFVKENSYLWQASLLLAGDEMEQKHELVVSFHHIIIDGLSIGIFFRDFCRCLENIAAGQDYEPHELSLLPPLESLLKKKVTWPEYVKGAKAGFAELLELQEQLYSYETSVPLALRKTKSIFYDVRSPELSRMIDACHENKTTLTCLMSAALLLATHQAFSDDKNGRRSQIAFTPVNMRIHCDPVVTPDNIGCFVSAVRTTHIMDKKTPLWPLARSFGKKLSRGLEEQAFTPSRFDKAEHLERMGSLDKGFLERKYHLGVGVTNYGVFDMPVDHGPFHIDEFYSGAARHWGDWLILAHAATLGKKLYVSFCYEEPLLSPERAKAIADKCLSMLNKV